MPKQRAAIAGRLGKNTAKTKGVGSQRAKQKRKSIDEVNAKGEKRDDEKAMNGGAGEARETHRGCSKDESV